MLTDVFYDDEQHRDEEYTEDSCNGCTKDDSNAHRVPVVLIIIVLEVVVSVYSIAIP